jgi:hypothetical protein
MSKELYYSSQNTIILFVITSLLLNSCSLLNNSETETIVNHYKNIESNSTELKFLYPAIMRENKIEGLISYKFNYEDSLKIEINHSILFQNSITIESNRKDKAEQIFLKRLTKYSSKRLRMKNKNLKCLYKLNSSILDKTEYEFDLIIESENVKIKKQHPIKNKKVYQ